MRISSFTFRFPSLAVSLAALMMTSAPAGPAAANVLENPAPGVTYSGVGLFSGWHCGATDLTIVVDKGTPNETTLRPAYGTERNDTVEICGTNETGFGILWNYALFGEGTHTAQAHDAGQPFGPAHTFEVMMVDPEQAFVTGLVGDYSIDGFPASGDSLRLVWQQGQQGFVIAGFNAAPETASTASAGTNPPERAAATQGAFEVPGPGSFQSGIIVMSGWACEAETVEIEIDGGAHRFAAAYGTERNDTSSICGQNQTGFGVLWNTNLLGPGEHTAVAFADGEILGSTTFTVTELDENANFLVGLEGSFPLAGFPEAGKTSTVTWTQATQNFVLTDVSDSTAPTPTPQPTPTPGATSTPAPTTTPSPTPTPTPAASFCGDGIVDYDLDEECDGADLDFEDCESLFGGFDGCNGALACTSDCKFDGSACTCSCEDDYDCELGWFDSTIINCGPTYCIEDVCSEDDLPDCYCEIEFGVCYGGTCLTTPLDPGLYETICFSSDDDGYALCDYCEEF